MRAFIFNLFVLFVWLWYYNLKKTNLFGLSFNLYFFKLSYGSNFLLYPVKNADASKTASTFLNFILLFYTYLVKTTLREVCFTLNKYESDFLNGKIPMARLSPAYLTSKKTSLYRAKFPNPLTCLKLMWVNK